MFLCLNCCCYFEYCYCKRCNVLGMKEMIAHTHTHDLLVLKLFWYCYNAIIPAITEQQLFISDTYSTRAVKG